MSKSKALYDAIVKRISGTFGKEFVIKNYNGTLYLSKYPRRSKKKPTKKQVGRRTVFMEAQAYASHAIRDEKEMRRIRKKLLPGQRAYNQFVAEYMRGHDELEKGTKGKKGK